MSPLATISEISFIYRTEDKGYYSGGNWKLFAQRKTMTLPYRCETLPAIPGSNKRLEHAIWLQF